MNSVPPTYAASMLRPYSKLLRKYPEINAEHLDALDALDADERVPIAGMLELLRATVQMTGDEDIGLKAAREIAPGEYGLIEFTVNSAPTLRQSIDLLGRYLPLVNDALEFSFRVSDNRAIIQLDSRIALPRAAVDFQSAAFYVAALQRDQRAVDPHYKALFRHAAPAQLDEYRKTFAPGEVQFGAAFDGFSFDASILELSPPSADSKLHDLLRKYADHELSELPSSESLTDKVRAIVARSLTDGEPGVAETARLLHTSRRTLARRLEEEGTSFRGVLDDTRRRLALRYVVMPGVGVTEIAFLLGFSQSGAFARAFRRWTGMTPLEYRRGRRK